MRVTSTNSGPDSKGAVSFGRWEFDGDAYVFVVGGAVASVLVFMLAGALAFSLRLLVALSPLAFALAWVRFFLVGRPPHFCGDYFEGLLVGRHFNLRPQDWTNAAHPHGERVRGNVRPERIP